MQGWLTGEGMAEEKCGFEQAAEAKKKRHRFPAKLAPPQHTSTQGLTVPASGPLNFEFEGGLRLCSGPIPLLNTTAFTRQPRGHFLPLSGPSRTLGRVFGWRGGNLNPPAAQLVDQSK